MSAAFTRALKPAEIPVRFTAADLQQMTFAPLKFIVPELLPQGLTILAAKPKIGKSWLSLDILNAVSNGGFTMGSRHCIAGDVLYCALEDSAARLKSRLAKFAQTAEAWSPRFNMWTALPPLEDGGLEALRGWIAESTDPRLIVIDTLQKVRSPPHKNETIYAADYRQLGDLHALARDHGIGVLVVHHTRKAEGDALDAVSGSYGVAGAADTIWVLIRTAGGVTLSIQGRDVGQQELAVEFQKDICRWRFLGDAAEVRQTANEAAILDTLRQAGRPIQRKEIADATGITSNTLGVTLKRMNAEGLVTSPKYGFWQASHG